VDITVDYMGLWVTAPDSAGTDFKVRWTSRPYATGYVLQEDTKSDFSTAKQIYSGADTTYTVPISGKTHGQVYYYRARVNTAYGYGPWYSKGGASTLGNIPGTIIIDAPDLPDEPVPINFVSIQGGTFQMGNVENASEGTSDEKPVHTVTVSGFEMGVYEITNAQYAKYLNEALVSGDVTATSSSVKGAKGAYSGQEYIYLSESYDSNNKCWITYSGGAFSVVSGHEKWPVVYVTWYGSKSFALYYGFDLPTEAEWEYACRGGKQYKYGTYDGTISSSKANYNSNVGYPKDAGSYSANPYGLYDMSGNVWEWCHDWYGSYSSGSVTNPTGAPTGTSRVIRGGGWDIYDIFCRSAFRYSNDPDYGSPSVGFRVVRR
jgi:formylglycine-generating enzyme required for sulfatase activity